MSGLEHGAFLNIGKIVSAVRPFEDTEPSRLLHNKVRANASASAAEDPGGKSSLFPPFSLIESGELSVFLSRSQNMDNLCAYSPALCPLPSATP